MADTVLFTGFPGFLGSRLLPRVLRRSPEAEAVCLVQSRFRETAERRAEELVAADADLAGRIHLVEGDITRPDLGLGAQRSELASSVREVFHLAAVYDLEVSRSLGMRVNVDGTRHVLDLCTDATDLQRLHYVSTCYVSGRWPGIFREEDLVLGQRFNNHYEETKYLAEVLVRERAAAGLPVTTYRPAVVGGDSTTGATQKYDGPYFLVRWLLKQPRVAFVPMVGDPHGYRFNIVPRDYVIDGIDALAARDDTVGGTYALADPLPYTIGEMLELFERVTRRRVVTFRLPLGLAQWALRRVPGVQRLMQIPPAAVAYLSHPTHYTNDAAAPLLAEEGVSLPDRADWFAAMADFVQANPDITSEAMV
jgi:thioester reductase-like protein